MRGATRIIGVDLNPDKFDVGRPSLNSDSVMHANNYFVVSYGNLKITVKSCTKFLHPE